MNNKIGNIDTIMQANFPVNEPLNSLGMTALHFASTNQNYHVLHRLLQWNASPNQPDSMGRTALHIAAGSGNFNAIYLLLQCDQIQVDSLSLGLETPLMKAIQFSKIECVKMLLDKGADPLNRRNASQLSALDFANISKNQQIIDMLNAKIAENGWTLPVQ